MQLSNYGIYPYRNGLSVRYFIEGVHGNFHLGSTDFITSDIFSFIKSKGGLMKVMNPYDKSKNSNDMFTTFGSLEVTFDNKETVHPFEGWALDYYHPQFDFVTKDDLSFLIYYRKKEAFLFLDPKIVLNDQMWTTHMNVAGLEHAFKGKLKGISMVMAFHCQSGNVFHPVTEGILQNKLRDLEASVGF